MTHLHERIHSRLEPCIDHEAIEICFETRIAPSDGTIALYTASYSQCKTCGFAWLTGHGSANAESKTWAKKSILAIHTKLQESPEFLIAAAPAR